MRSKRVKNTGTSASLFESLYGSRLAANVISCACCALSPSARRLENFHRKIAKGEEEISPRFHSLLRRMNFPE